MRIIAGDLRGRRLKSVPGKQTRPTSDKVKEAAFQIMGPYFEGGTCLDLFAGSGSLGIEAISRGIDYVVFIDKQRKAIQTIHENIQMLKIEKQTEVSQMDANRALRVTHNNKACFDLILIDPPYEAVDYKDILDGIVTYNLVNKSGIIYCEHSASDNLPEELAGFSIIKQTTYGSTTGITIYQKKT